MIKGRFISVLVAFVFMPVFVAHAAVPTFGQELRNNFTIYDGDAYTNGITVRRSLTIENNGTIGGVLAVDDECHLTIRNRGDVTVGVVLGTGATITQLISTGDDITRLNLGGADYDVLVNGQDLSFEAILANVNAATRVIFRDSVLNMGTSINAIRAFNSTIELQGDTVIEIADEGVLNDILSGPLLTGVTGDGTLVVRVTTDNPLYAYESYIVEEDLFLRRVRFTDYSDIFGNNMGDFLDWLRDMLPDDSLLYVLDNAKTMDEINSILARAARVNPINLMRPVRMLNSFEMNQADFGVRSGMFAAPVIIMADDFSIYGANVGVVGRVLNGLGIKLTAYAATFDYSDDINDFGGDVYGANVAAHYDFDIAFVRAIAGASYATFDVGPVFDGTGVTMGPRGRAIYGLADIGHRFDINKDIYIAPFIGAGFDSATILHQSDTTATARIGADAGYGFTVAGIRYDYGARVYANNNGINGALHMSAWSEFDDAGVDAMIGTDGDDIGRAYKFSISGKFRF